VGVSHDPLVRVFVQKRHLSAQGGVFTFFAILNVAKLRLRLQKCSSLALNQNLPLLNEHRLVAKNGIFRPIDCVFTFLKSTH